MAVKMFPPSEEFSFNRGVSRLPPSSSSNQKPIHNSFSASSPRKPPIPKPNAASKSLKKQGTTTSLHQGSMKLKTTMHGTLISADYSKPSLSQPHSSLHVATTKKNQFTDNTDPTKSIKRGAPPSEDLKETKIKKKKTTGVNDVSTCSVDTADSELSLSPSAIRVAMLKNRFADTIFKTQKERLIQSSSKEKLEKELAKLEKKQRQEKEKMATMLREAQKRADEELKKKQEIERRQQEKQRKQKEERAELERKKLLEKQRAIDKEENDKMEIEGKTLRMPICCMLKEIDVLKNCAQWSCWSYWGFHHQPSPLEKMGLFIKEDHVYDDSEGDDDLEEGEIFD